MSLKFINPFNGSPSPLQLTGLFLFNPQTYFDIGGCSISAIFKLLGKESLLKRMESVRRGEKIPPERLLRLLTELLDAGEVSDSLRKRFCDEVGTAISDDARGEFNPASIGEYESAVAAYSPDGQKLGMSQEFLLDIERKSRPALLLAYRGRFSDDLSSGERHILTFLSLVVFLGQNRDFLIIDEPEISLNIIWQRQLLELFAELVPNTQIIVASHSPVLSRRRPEFLTPLVTSTVMREEVL